MSDIPNPIGAFEIFSFKKEKKLSKPKLHNFKKLSKKLAKKLNFVKNIDPWNKDKLK